MTARAAIAPVVRQQLIDCWIAVTNAGGAAGFPFPPVAEEHVTPILDALLDGLHPERGRLLVALRAETLVGWVFLHRDPNPLVAHWATVRHLQTHPAHRGRGHGAALMRAVHRVARDDMGLTQLHLAVRAGMGLEAFYAKLGWREVGRWPNALRLAAHDIRDEVLMALAPL